MNIKKILTSTTFVVAASLSSLASAVSMHTYTPTSTLGQLVSQTAGDFLAEGYDVSTLTPATAQTVYSSYVWSFAGDSIMGTSSVTNVDIMATLFSPFATGGTVNLQLLASQLSGLDDFLDQNFVQAISLIGQLPSSTNVYGALLLAGVTLDTQQAALLATSSLQIKLTAVPVPATLVLLLGGLGLIVAARRQSISSSN